MEWCKDLVMGRSKTELINTMLESSAEHPLDILDTDPYPSNLDLALFAGIVKTAKEVGETDAAYGKRLELP